MANGGWHGTQDEWERLEAPLVEVDPIIAGFARGFGLSVTRNHKSWPERSISWGDTVSCLIQLYREPENEDAFTLWICASEDRGSKRFWKQRNLVKAGPIASFRSNLPQLLREGRNILLEWSSDPDCLEFVADLR